MLWPDIRNAYPNQWLIVEALEAHTTSEHQRQLDRLAVIEVCENGLSVMGRYRKLHQEYPQREFYFVHTSREELEIQERQWHGIRTGNSIVAPEKSFVHNGKSHFLREDRFRVMAENGDDALLDAENMNLTSWDQEEWDC